MNRAFPSFFRGGGLFVWFLFFAFWVKLTDSESKKVDLAHADAFFTMK